MKFLQLLFLFTFSFTISHAQNDVEDAIYKNFPVYKVYEVEIRTDLENGKNIYELEVGKEKEIDKKTGRAYYCPIYKRISKDQYEKYNNAIDSLIYCRPCIVETYNAEDKLIMKSIKNYLCHIGPFTYYSKNGGIKVKGNFTFDDSSKLDIACLSKYHGNWIYYNDSGSIETIEYWDNGNFIKQIPERKINELWKVELKYEGKKFDQSDSIQLDAIKKLKIIPFFKNQSKIGTEIKIEIELSAPNKAICYFKTDIENLFNISFEESLNDNKYNAKDKLHGWIHFYNNEKYFRSFSLNIRQ